MIFSFTISKKEKKKSTLEITIGGGKKDLKKKNTKKKIQNCACTRFVPCQAEKHTRLTYISKNHSFKIVCRL